MRMQLITIFGSQFRYNTFIQNTFPSLSNQCLWNIATCETLRNRGKLDQGLVPHLMQIFQVR